MTNDAAARKEAYEAITRDPNLSSPDKARGRLALTLGTDALGLGDNARLRELQEAAAAATPATAQTSAKEWVAALPTKAKTALYDALEADLLGSVDHDGTAELDDEDDD